MRTNIRDMANMLCDILDVESGEKVVKLYSKADGSLVAEGASLKKIIKEDYAIRRILQKRLVNIFSYHGKMFYGFSEREQKWYVWSLKGTYKASFGIGSRITKSDIAYEPDNRESYKKRVLDFWKGQIYESAQIFNETEKEFDVIIRWSNDPQVIKNEKARGGFTVHHYYFPEDYGRGEWVARTVGDAREMVFSWIKGISR